MQLFFVSEDGGALVHTKRRLLIAAIPPTMIVALYLFSCDVSFCLNWKQRMTKLLDDD